MALTELTNMELIDDLKGIQNDLFTVGSDLASPLEKESKNFTIPRIDQSFVKQLETLIDKYDSHLPELKNFILPGGLKGSAILHQARTVCRRAEREVVALSKICEINNLCEVYLNRLSDLLFVFARFENYSNNSADITWHK